MSISLLNNKAKNIKYHPYGLSPKLRWYSRGFPEGITTEIKDKTEGIFGIASPVRFKNEPEFWALDFPSSYKIIKGKSKVEILFGGNTKKGETRNYKLYAIIDYDGKNANIEIWA